MSNNEKHLFIFEGKKEEPKYHKMLEENFFKERVSIECVYDAEIYQLYSQMKNDDFEQDIVTLLTERNAENAAILQDYTNDSFASIYLFFDYDAHSTMADDVKIQEMLSFFNNETEHGMLYISYPMVEALRHYHDMASFKTLAVKCKRGTTLENTHCPYKDDCEDIDDCLKEPHYKTLFKSQCLPELFHLSSRNHDLWKELVLAHTSKANYIVNDAFELPSDIIPQDCIFYSQQEKYINHKCPMVAVLSGFPMYVLDYYGAEKLKQLLMSM